MDLSEITESLGRLDNWSLEGNTICKTFQHENFKQALEFTNKIGELAEEQQHHPDITIRYNQVSLTLTTHSSNELTEKDFSLAEQIDKIGQTDKD